MTTRIERTIDECYLWASIEVGYWKSARHLTPRDDRDGDSVAGSRLISNQRSDETFNLDPPYLIKGIMVKIEYFPSKYTVLLCFSLNNLRTGSPYASLFMKVDIKTLNLRANKCLHVLQNQCYAGLKTGLHFKVSNLWSHFYDLKYWLYIDCYNFDFVLSRKKFINYGV